MSKRPDTDIAAPHKDADMSDFSGPGGDDFTTLSRDRFLIRSLEQNDLSAIIRIDRKFTGFDRTAFYEAKLAEVTRETGVRVSLVAELDGGVVGFVMARVDFGEFGRAEPSAAIDAVAVNPDYAGRGVGKALLSQLLANLASLRVENVRTMARWNNFDLLRFLNDCGFEPSQRLVLSKTID